MDAFILALPKKNVLAFLKDYHVKAYDGLAVFAQNVKVNAPEMLEESNPATDAPATSMVTEMEVAAGCADNGFETVVTKAV